MNVYVIKRVENVRFRLFQRNIAGLLSFLSWPVHINVI